MHNTEFFDAIKDEVHSRLRGQGENVDASIQDVVKTNGVVYHGLTLKSNINIAPVIYLDDFFKVYEEGDITMQECVEKVVDIYNKNIMQNDFDIESIRDFDVVKDKIVLGIYNTEANAELLKEMPHKDFCDLSLYYRIGIDVDENTKGYIAVNNKIMDAWGKTVGEIHELAWSNMKKRNPAKLRSMCEILKDTFGMEEDVIDGIAQEPQMFVLSSFNNIFGAVYMADTQELERIADDLEKDLIILPSSRHEVIILPTDTTQEGMYEKYKEMVRDVNVTQVDAEDFLSNNIYIFSRATKELEMVA